LAACAVPEAEAIDVEATVERILTESAPPAGAPPTELPTVEATAPPAPDRSVYQDPSAGIEFEYPSTWVVGPVQQYSRGGITAFTSWDRLADVLPDATPPGGTRMDVTVQLWDPTGDLEAFLAQRHLAWDASGITVLAEDRWTLDDGRPAVSFVVEGIDGEQAHFFFTTIGDRYLVLSGNGDLALLAEIAHTVRPVPTDS
jgi:hypothetical protein